MSLFDNKDKSKNITAKDIPDILKHFLPLQQQKMMIGSNEFWDELKQLTDIVSNMPVTYEQENVPTNEKKVYLHYFLGGSNWFIVEKDIEHKQYQAFGYAILNGDLEMAEWGYISIEEFLNTAVNLDFYFEPKTFAEVRKEYFYGATVEGEFIDAFESHKEMFMRRYGIELYYIEEHDGDKVIRLEFELGGHGELYMIGKAEPQNYSPSVEKELYQIQDDLNDIVEGNVPTYLHPYAAQEEMQIIEKNGETIYTDGTWDKFNHRLYEIARIIHDPLQVQVDSMADDDPKYSTIIEKAKADFREQKAKQKLAVEGIQLEAVPEPVTQDGKIRVKKILLANTPFDNYQSANGGLRNFINKRLGSNAEYEITFADGFVLSGVIDCEPNEFWADKWMPFTWHLNTFWNNVANATPYTEVFPTKQDIEFAKMVVENYDLGIKEEEPEEGLFIMQQQLYEGNWSDMFAFNAKGKSQAILLKTAYAHYHGHSAADYRPVQVTFEEFLERPVQLHNEYVDEFREKQSLKPTKKKSLSIPEEKVKEVGLIEQYKGKPQAAINNEIRRITAEKGIDRTKYSADELAFLKLYEGAGGLAKQGETGVGLLDQFFTPMLVVKKMWGLAVKHGFKFKGSVLEPAVGSGRFLEAIPKGAKVDVTAYDIDQTCYIINKVLYPQYNVYNASFETMFFEGKRHTGLSGLRGRFDIVIGNPPYREYISAYAPLGEKEQTGALTFDMYFLRRGIDVLVPGGLLVMIIPNTFLSNGNKYNDFKERFSKSAELLEAWRLPNGIFDNTDVGTDIVVFRKK